MPKVLFAVTSYQGPFYDDGAKTGLFTVEAIHPYEVFSAKGYDITVVSETGSFGYDEHSTAEPFLTGDDLAVFQDPHSAYNIAFKDVKKASDVNAEEYDIFFAAGGHGCVFDFPKAKDLVKAAETIYSKGGVVSAVCHGPAIFESMKDPATGKSIIEGKNVTGFLDEAETMLGLEGAFEKYNVETPQKLFKKVGATFKAPAGPWDDLAVTDGRIVTGTNPASAASTAKAAILASQ